MSNIKMSDVFPEGYKLTFDYCPTYTGTEDTFGFIFQSPEPCVFICDAVNNYDRLQQENAELVELLHKLVNPENCKKDIIHIIGKAESLLERLI